MILMFHSIYMPTIFIVSNFCENRLEIVEIMTKKSIFYCIETIGIRFLLIISALFNNLLQKLVIIHILGI